MVQRFPTPARCGACRKWASTKCAGGPGGIPRTAGLLYPRPGAGRFFRWFVATRDQDKRHRLGVVQISHHQVTLGKVTYLLVSGPTAGNNPDEDASACSFVSLCMWLRIYRTANTLEACMPETRMLMPHVTTFGADSVLEPQSRRCTWRRAATGMRR